MLKVLFNFNSLAGPANLHSRTNEDLIYYGIMPRFTRVYCPAFVLYFSIGKKITSLSVGG